MAPVTLSDKFRKRFLGKLRRDESTGCLVWTKWCNKGGYGRVRIRGSSWYAHRIAWLLAGNEITSEKPCVLHNCPAGDNPACCEPSHLWAGTQAENATDMYQKGRGHKSSRGLPAGVRANNNRYQAAIVTEGKRQNLGSFKTAAEAGEAYQKAKKRQ